ncbi:MAG: SdiA-regulated domain-containing protein, partial [Bacteroidales bacterium]|nr:SdiA-regulated domain-containing protein [Bacteroidales bacterium]
YIDYAYAKAYMYNFNSDLNAKYQIIKDGKIDETALPSEKRLSAKQIEQLIDLTNKKVEGLITGLSKCFNPHHAIVFFDNSDKPIASVMFDFNCEAIRVQPKKISKKRRKELSEKEINKLLNILKEYRKITDELNCPVFNTVAEYQYYKKNELAKNIKNLDLKQNGIKQLKQDKKERFDLSGICEFKNKIYVVADKNKNNYLYKIDTTTNSFGIYPEKTLCPDRKIDFEGIAVYKNKFFLINEWFDNVLMVTDSCKLKDINIEWERAGIDNKDWGNKGLEGIAFDEKNGFLYLAKEREPRRIFKIDLKTGIISEPFKKVLANQTIGYDISDMKFENGYLYILERSSGTVIRIDVKTNKTISYSYQHIVYKNGQRIFSNKFPQYGMAEALLLTKDEIWIGLDNNGDPVSEYGKSLGLQEGNSTVILIFKRPDNF